MPQIISSKVVLKGNKKDQATFTEVHQHYTLARNDLQNRITRENGYDDSDRLYYGKLKEDWPFETKIFDHQIKPAIQKKTSRLIGGKPKGRFVAREGSDEIGAYILNELFNFQWEDVSRVGLPLIIRWALMDQQVRRYGDSYMICPWRFEERGGKTFFDGPDAKVIYRRDSLPNPSYSEVKHWFQYREWVTLDELEKINDISKTKMNWKNLELIKETLRADIQAKGGSDTRNTEYLIKGKTLRGLEDTLGRDSAFKVFELVHEFRNSRWVSFAPELGIILRDIDNPYEHGQIPVVQLKYDPNLDDIAGIGDIEIASPHQRAVNALLCAYVDAIVQDLYPPLHINPTGVKMHTIEWKPGAKWMMNRPGQDVVRMATTTPGVREFTDAYALLTGSLNNSLGETTAALSQLQPFGTERTASEIRETSVTRNTFDNFNQVMLAEALKKQAYFWLELNKQYLFKSPKDQMKVIRIVGRDAINFFTQMGMDQFDEGGPRFPIELPGGGVAPQFDTSISGQEGNLFITKKDIQGTFDFVPDVESMQVASEQQMEAKLNIALQLLTNPTIIQLMAAEGKKPRVTELLIKLLETTRVIKNAEQFFENVPSPSQPGVTEQPGVNEIPIEGGTSDGGFVTAGSPGPGLGGSTQPVGPSTGV